MAFPPLSFLSSLSIPLVNFSAGCVGFGFFFYLNCSFSFGGFDSFVHHSHRHRHCRLHLHMSSSSSSSPSNSCFLGGEFSCIMASFVNHKLPPTSYHRRPLLYYTTTSLLTSTPPRIQTNPEFPVANLFHHFSPFYSSNCNTVSIHLNHLQCHQCTPPPPLRLAPYHMHLLLNCPSSPAQPYADKIL